MSNQRKDMIKQMQIENEPIKPFIVNQVQFKGDQITRDLKREQIFNN
jgi:hypothetical protein